MKHVTLIFPYYENPTMLEKQLENIAAYPQELRDHLQLIVVDDGSPDHPARIKGDPGCEFAVYRCKVDVRWNWMFCRNLGADRARHSWLMMTDIDHMIPEATMRTLICDEHDKTCVYRFSRVRAPTMEKYHPHPNSWFLTRKMFDRIGGYDERFAGWYGSDGDFRHRAEETARAVYILPDVLILYPREVIPDASTTRYGRKEPKDHENLQRIRRERAQDPDPRPKRLTFPWERVQ